jgi:hypothetical protein
MIAGRQVRFRACQYFARPLHNGSTVDDDFLDLAKQFTVGKHVRIVALAPEHEGGIDMADGIA